VGKKERKDRKDPQEAMESPAWLALKDYPENQAHQATTATTVPVGTREPATREKRELLEHADPWVYPAVRVSRVSA